MIASNDRAEMKRRFREKVAAQKALPASERIANTLHATNTHADAQTLINALRAEAQEEMRAARDELQARLNRLMDLCDEMERKGITSGEPFTVRRVHAIALGDDVKGGQR